MSEISEFYKGKSVFLTGVTGFVGKALLEKLLRSCPEVRAIYCLVRPKKSKFSKERLEDTLKDPVFETARKGTSIKCVQAIEGDISLAGLGLSSADRELLQEHVNVVLHCAATVRFNEAVKYATQCNLRSVKDLIELSHGMRHLESFVYLSTAFTNCELNVIDEKIYPCAVSPQNLLQLIETLDDESLERLTPELLGQKPNTYTLTKHLAEVLLQTEASDLPVSIVRPPALVATLKEPIPGWISGWGGINVTFVAAAMGIIQVIHTDENHRVDLIPVDLAVNLMLAASWYDRRTGSFGTKTYPTVYHLSLATERQATWCSMRSCLKNHVDKYPYKQSLRPFTAQGTRYRWVYHWKVLTSHWLFGCMFDGLSVCFGKKPTFLSTYKKVYANTQMMDYFLIRDWTWRTERTDAMRSNLSATDQEMFPFEPMRINWDTFWINYYEGIRRYVLKEDMDGVERARARVSKIRAMQFTLKLLAVCVTCGIAESTFGLVREAINWTR